MPKKTNAKIKPAGETELEGEILNQGAAVDKNDEGILPENENLNVTDGVEETADAGGVAETAESAPAVAGSADETAENAPAEAGNGVPKATKPGYVPYNLPFAPGTQPGDYESVGLNGINYRVKYGVDVEIPIGVAEILDRRRRQALRYAEQLKKAQENECIGVVED